MAYERSKASGAAVPIEGVAVYDPGTRDPSRGQNDMMVTGLSQIACYNAIFGYRLEGLPLGDLHPGPALEATSGYLNIKNPSCYVFPKENNCQPGDHFKVEERADAEKFLQYKPFPFKKSFLQRTADKINLAFLLAVFFALIYPPLKRLLKYRLFK